MFQKVIDSAKLISMPDIYLKLRELMDEPDYTMAEVALLVGRDPGMAGRFLRVVNSPLYRRIRRIDTVSQAVSLLGLRQVHDIVLSASIAEAFDGIHTDVMDMKKFWQRSFYCAVMTKELSQHCDIREDDRLFLTGLLHDIGHLFMYMAIPDESLDIIVKAKNEERPYFEVERELLGFDYAKVGGYMMQQWHLPISLQVITSSHPEPGTTTQFATEAAMLHIACLLAQSDLEEGEFGVGTFIVDPAAWQLTALSKEKCLEARQTASDQFNEVAENITALDFG